MERIINKENYMDYNVEGDAVESLMDSVGRDEVVQGLDEMKTIKSSSPSDVSLKLIAVSEC